MGRDALDALDDGTIRLLLDADPTVRQYLSKVVGTKPVERTVDAWEDERPGDLDAVFGEDGIDAVLNLVTTGDPVDHVEKQPPVPAERRFADDLRDGVYEEVREAQRRLALSPTEFAVYLLSQAAGWSDDAVAAELDLEPNAVAARLRDAREQFRTAMRTIDLAERVDDPELADDLRGWRIHRDPVT